MDGNIRKKAVRLLSVLRPTNDDDADMDMESDTNPAWGRAAQPSSAFSFGTVHAALP
jgi:hypothetical protein